MVVGGFGVSLNLWTDVEGSANHACHVTCRIVMPKPHKVSGETFISDKTQCERLSNSLHLLGLVWTSLLSCSPPLQIYLQPERDKQHLYEFITSSLLEFYILNLPSSTAQPVSKVKKLSTYHIGSMVRSQAKVSNLHMVLWVEEDVDRLQVPVNHALKERRMDEESGVNENMASFLTIMLLLLKQQETWLKLGPCCYGKRLWFISFQRGWEHKHTHIDTCWWM